MGGVGVAKMRGFLTRRRMKRAAEAKRRIWRPEMMAREEAWFARTDESSR